jgi:hypothetical protein
MRTVFDVCFGIIAFLFKAFFAFIGIIMMIIIGGAPD